MAKRPGDKPDRKLTLIEPGGGDYKIKPQKPTGSGVRPKGERPESGGGKGKPAR